MESGTCPHCLNKLILEEKDINLGVIFCPICSHHFLLSESQNDDKSKDPLKINIRILRNSDGSIKLQEGYKAEIASNQIDKIVRVTADSIKKLYKKIYKFGEKINKIEQKRKPILVTKEIIRNQDGSIRASNGYKAKVLSRELDKEKKVSADNPDEFVSKMNKRIEELTQAQKEARQIQKAKEDTKKAQALIENLENLLKKEVHELYWDDLKRNDKFFLTRPVFNTPKPNSQYARPKKDIFEYFFYGYRIKREKKREAYLQNLFKKWKQKNVRYQICLLLWKLTRKKFNKNKNNWNKQIAENVNKMEKGNREAIISFFSNVLKKSDYPPKFPQEFDLDYKKTEKILIVEYVLPNESDIPRYEEFKYIKSRKTTKAKKIKKSKREELYNQVLYSIPLRSLKEIFNNDRKNNLKSVVFNGWVKKIDKSTGNIKTICIQSLHAKKEDFEKIKLSKVDPEKCFKGLKGVASSKLSELAPIAPILKINKKDTRFIGGKRVLKNVNSSRNIALMDWEEFEHLVREVFEKEFEKTGMEVKVTQSSRDLGVDAVAFDPDPLRGGKIIIQAKRYANTVKVESVRALYGIMQDEGAMKGVLVTTSDYGPDAYKFAQDKPITLINGNNLLSMLEDHGHKSRIDLEEAREKLKGRTRV